MRKYLIPILLMILVSVIFLAIPSLRYEIGKELNFISAGSYAYAESYVVPYSEESVINAIETFKQENQKYNLPKVFVSSNKYFDLEDLRTENGLWFVVYFFEPKQKRIFKVAIRGNKAETTIHFDGMNDGLKLGQWKTINKDFPYYENEKIKDEFENLYFNPIIQELKK